VHQIRCRITSLAHSWTLQRKIPTTSLLLVNRTPLLLIAHICVSMQLSLDRVLVQCTHRQSRIGFTGDTNHLRMAQTFDNNIQLIIDHLTGPHFERNYTLAYVISMHFTNLSKPVLCVLVGSLRRNIMQITHETSTHGDHFGRDKTSENSQSILSGFHQCGYRQLRSFMPPLQGKQ
jgi:hypothetical protein